MERKLLLGLVIFLLVLGVVPIHELRHIILAKALGGEIKEVFLFSFSSDSKGEYYGGWVEIENIPYNWKWFLVVLAGGCFQGFLYLAIGFIFSCKRFLQSKKKQFFWRISLTSLILGIFGILIGIYELWTANQGIYPL